MSLSPPKIDGLKSTYITGKNFRFCINIAEKNFYIEEKINQRWKTLYYYVVYGQGVGYNTYDPSKKYTFEQKKICDARLFLLWDSTTYECSEKTEIIGFNSTSEDDIWEAELIDKNQTYIKCEYPSVIFCFNGNMQINGKLLNKYNFANLNKDSEYQLELNDESEIGLFKLIQ